MLFITDLGPTKINKGFVIDWFETRLDIKLQNEKHFQNERDVLQQLYQEMDVWRDQMSLNGKTYYVHRRCVCVIPCYDLGSLKKNIYDQTDIDGI